MVLPCVCWCLSRLVKGEERGRERSRMGEGFERDSEWWGRGVVIEKEIE